MITRGGQTKGAPSPAIAIGTADPTPRGQPAAFRGETLEVPYKRIIAIQEGKPEDEPHVQHCHSGLVSMIGIRKKYMVRALQSFSPRLLSYFGDKDTVCTLHGLTWTEYKIMSLGGIIQVVAANGQVVPDLQPYYTTLDEYKEDYAVIKEFVYSGEMRTYCEGRLFWLQQQFEFHHQFNEAAETAQQKLISSKDFSSVMKIDNHTHGGGSMTRDHLLSFIKRKAKSNADTPVLKRQGGKLITLKELLTDLKIDADTLSLDKLNVHSECKLFNRFDHFNNKYNICGQHELRQVFLKWKNDFGGTFYSELLKEVIDQLPDQTCAEIRLSVHGVSKDEFDKLAEWAKTHNLISKKIKWIIQVPRLYDVYKEKGLVKTFQELLDNVFLLLFECTNSPKSHKHLSWSLQHIVGFDTVDDESTSEPPFDKDTPTAADWTTINNPPYQLYNFYFYANIAVLNRFRA